MAKQVGPLFITSTIDGIIFYKLGDQYYIRSKGDYKSAKRMRKDPRLKRTMEKANQFGQASRLVKEVYYRQLPREVRRFGLFGKLTGMVNRWLQKGKSREEVKDALIAHCQTLQTSTATVLKTQEVAIPKATPTVSSPITKMQTVVTPTTKRVKQARYLSKWKIKPNGRLQIPKDAAVGCLPAGTNLISSA